MEEDCKQQYFYFFACLFVVVVVVVFFFFFFLFFFSNSPFISHLNVKRCNYTLSNYQAVFFCNISYKECCCNPHKFSTIRILWCCIWYLCLGLSFLSISTKISTNNFHLTSLWRHICQNGKNSKIYFWP